MPVAISPSLYHMLDEIIGTGCAVLQDEQDVLHLARMLQLDDLATWIEQNHETYHRGVRWGFVTVDRPHAVLHTP